jgi:hypothetical protein
MSGRTHATLFGAHGGKAAVIAAVLALARAAAAEEPPIPDPNAVETHAFVSQGFMKTTENEYLTHSKRGSLEFTEVGINFTKRLTDDLRFGVQLFANDLGPNGNYTPRFDWYYLDWHFADWLGVRAGHVKIPFGLYNESADIDAARVPILLPQAVYPIDHRDYLLAQTGGELYGSVRLGAAGALGYTAYGGTLAVNAPATLPPAVKSITDLDARYIVGGRLSWLPPLDGLTLSGSLQQLQIGWTYNIDPNFVAPLQSVNLLPADNDGSLPVKFKVTLWVASAEYQAGNLLLASEYSRWAGEFTSAAPALLPPRVVNERWYAMAAYHVTPWFTPGVYYSSYSPNIHRRGARQTYQHDAALTLRYDLSAHWLLKLEGHFMQGTAALDNPALNGGKPADALVKQWGALLVKTTAYF